jgi:hypothetical protein
MTRRPFNNSATQAEKQQVLRNELKKNGRAPTTYHQIQNVSDALGGRFDRADTNAGEAPNVQYPRQPFSPWTNTSNAEPPTGVAIDDQLPTGNFHEIERSLATVAAIRFKSRSAAGQFGMEIVNKAMDELLACGEVRVIPQDEQIARQLRKHVGKPGRWFELAEG